MDAFETARDDRPDTQQRRTLGGPVPRAAGAVIPAGENDDGPSLRAVAFRNVHQIAGIARRQMTADRPSAIRHQGIAQARIGKGAAQHHLVIDAPRSITAKAVRLDTKRREIARRRSEEHTSELQSLMRIPYAVFCLQKKNTNADITNRDHSSTKQRTTTLRMMPREY